MAGLCLAAALSVMAFAAASAQAEVGSHWNVNGSAISATLLPVPEATLENNHGQLLARALTRALNILCTAVTFEEAVLKTEGSSLGKVRFSGCLIYSFKNEGTEKQEVEVLPACEPKTTEGGEVKKGVILTKLLKDLIILHTTEAEKKEGKTNPEGYDRLEPEEGTTFVTIESSAECSFGSKIPVIGKFVFKDCSLRVKDKEGKETGACIPQGREERVTHLVEEGPLTELWVISKTEEHKSTIDGSANVFLTGKAHEGLKWSGTPA